jgi:hypothetical protein
MKILDQAELEEIMDYIEVVGLANENKKSFKMQSIEDETKNANSQSKLQKATKLELEIINSIKEKHIETSTSHYGKLFMGATTETFSLCSFTLRMIMKMRKQFLIVRSRATKLRFLDHFLK